MYTLSEKVHTVQHRLEESLSSVCVSSSPPVLSVSSFPPLLKVMYFPLLFCLLFCFETGFLCVRNSPCPGTHFIDQVGLELRDLPASASVVLGLKACTITSRLTYFSYVLGYMPSTPC